jgi:predicted MFS family arabinose efflux permease
MSTATLPMPVVARRRLVSGALALLFLANFGALSSFYLLLAVVPQYATAGAGAATGALMLSTVAAELVTPRLVARAGYRTVLAAGLLLLGVPALLLPASASMPAILAVCLLRGVGLAIIFVVSGELSAVLVPPERRGEGLGVFGVVAGLPAVLALPLGLWLAEQTGYPAVFVAGGLVALAALVALPGLPDRQSASPERSLGVLAAARTPALARPSIAFAVTAMGAGVVVTFLPAAVRAGGAAGLAPAALLTQAAAGTVSRWWAGRYADRHGGARLLAPGVLAVAAGMLGLVIGGPVAVLGGMALFGGGFGMVQNASLTLMFARARRSGYGAASALWNVAYDGGLGLGAAGFGVLVPHTGYPAAFALAAGVMLLAVPLALSARSGRSR